MVLHMLTTVDNLFDPFSQFDEWYAFDEAAGYYTSGYLARIVKTSDELSEADQDLAQELAIEEIIRENPAGPWVRVSQKKDATTA